jgi:hypothetical protein
MAFSSEWSDVMQTFKGELTRFLEGAHSGLSYTVKCNAIKRQIDQYIRENHIIINDENVC